MFLNLGANLLHPLSPGHAKGKPSPKVRCTPSYERFIALVIGAEYIKIDKLSQREIEKLPVFPIFLALLGNAQILCHPLGGGGGGAQ